MYKLKAIMEVIWMIVVPILITNTVIYLLGSFIAWSWDPGEWWLITSTWGRFVLVIIELSVIANIPKFWDDF